MASSQSAEPHFSALSQLYANELPSLETALQICQKSLQTSQASGLQVFQLWTTQLPDRYHLQQAKKASKWLGITECLHSALQQVLQQALNTTDNLSANAADLNNLLGNAKKFLIWAQLFCLNESSVRALIILCFLLQLVLQFWSHQRQLQECCAPLPWNLVSDFYLETLELLNGNVINMNVSEQSEHAQAIKLLQLLFQLTELPINVLTLKCSVKTWHSIVQLITKSCSWSYLLNSTDGITADMRPSAFAQRPLNYFFKFIKSIIKPFHQEQILQQQPIEKIDKTLRLANLYVKIVLRLAQKLPHAEFPACGEYFELLKLIQCAPSFVLQHPVKSLLDKHVLKHLLEMLLVLYKNETIKELILDALNTDDIRQSAVLIFNFLHANIAGKDHVFINENANFYIEIFDKLTKDVGIFLDAQKNDLLQQYFTALTILCSNGQLKKHLVHCVVHAHYIAAHNSSEILMIVARATHKKRSAASFLQEYHFWRKCNDNLNIISMHFKRNLFENLLKYYFSLGTCSKRIDNSELLKHCVGEKFLHPNNYRFLLALGLQRVCDAIGLIELKQIHAKLQQETEIVIRNLDANLNMENYHKLFVYIELLSSAHLPPASRYFKLILAMLPKCFEIVELSGRHYLVDLTNAIYNLATQHNDAHLSEHVLNALQTLQSQKAQTLDILFESTTLLKLLHVCSNTSTNMKLQTLSKNLLMRMLANKNSKHLTEAHALLSDQKHALKHWNLSNAAYEQICAKTNLDQHANCSSTTSLSADCTQPFKRRRLLDENDTSLKSLIKDVCEKAKLISDKTAIQQLDAQDSDALQMAVKNLTNVLQKN